MKNEFQYRLVKSIEKADITAAELSAKTGISEANISNYINGKYVAKQDKCYALAVALGVDPGWLMTGDEPKQNVFPSFVELPQPEHEKGLLSVIAAWSKAQDWQKQAVLKILNIEE